MAKQTINIGSSANSGGGDPLRNALIKVNENFDEVYAKLEALEDGNVVTDIKGNVFAEDSTLLVDAVNASIPYSVLSGAPTIPTALSDLAGDYQGSVFADDSTLLVDGVTGKIVGPIETTVATITNGLTLRDIYAQNAFGVNITVNGFNNLVVTQSAVTIQNVALNPTAGITGYISIADLKTLVAASTDFGDFQTRIAAL